MWRQPLASFTNWDWISVKRSFQGSVDAGVALPQLLAPGVS